MVDSTFSRDEIHRYSRQFILPDFGARGQKRLKASRVLVIGAGGLGSPAALYLAAGGVGTLGLVDFDAVDLSNLQRQILHATPDVGHSKVDSAANKLCALNPEVKIVKHAVHLSNDNALELFEQYDLVLDGTDNFATRYLINDACLLIGIPNVSASVFRFEGQLSVFGAKNGPCYRCLYPEPPPAGMVAGCGEGGVLGIVTGVVGTLQATEAIKFLAGIGESLAGRLMLFDALTMQFRELTIRKDPDCPTCGTAPTITALQDYEAFCGTGRPEVEEITALQLKARLDAGEKIQLVDVREPGEREINHIAGAIVIPLEELGARAGEVRGDQPVLVFCRVGARSATGVVTLQKLGFKRVINLKGGIEAWLDEVDDDQPRY